MIELTVHEKDAQRFRQLADCDGVSISKWLVQVRHKDRFGTCYFADPPGGPVAEKAPSILAALRIAVDRAAQSESEGAIK